MRPVASVFVFGPLAHAPLLHRVLGTSGQGGPARITDHAVYAAGTTGLAMLCPQPGAVAQGLCLDGLREAAAGRLAYYAESQGLHPMPVAICRDGQVTGALAFLPGTDMRPGAPWDQATWAAECGALETAAVDEVMLGHGAHPAAVNARRRTMILARAASRLRAERPAPATLRRPTRPDDFDERARSQPYARFFAVEEYDFRHRRFDGSWSAEVNRAAFLSGDAATVLPYDPARDAVLLIEQVRVGPYARGDSQCWSIEVIAGLVDPGESPQTTVRREAREEAGIEIGALHPVYDYYPSPGARAEFIYSYLGAADLHEGVAGLGGLAAEGEDIRAHVLPFVRAMALVASGEIGNAPTILSLLWLARNRDRLRAAG